MHANSVYASYSSTHPVHHPRFTFLLSHLYLSRLYRPVDPQNDPAGHAVQAVAPVERKRQ